MKYNTESKRVSEERAVGSVQRSTSQFSNCNGKSPGRKIVLLG